MVIRRLGLNRTLLLFPTLCLGAIVCVYSNPTLEMVFLAMLLLKGFSYCLNNPCKEILYQPTSSSVKFKAKSWIDVFGARGSKALGSVVTNQFSDSAADLLTYGSFVAMGVSSFLIYVAYWQGAQFDDLIEAGVKVGEEPTDDAAAETAGDGDTSCGMDDEKAAGETSKTDAGKTVIAV
jgi:AAA family ATP:ADP antiporter